MPVVGEAIYELSARDEKLLGALKRAESKASSSGRAIENAVDGDGATKGFDNASNRVGRFGGMLDKVKGKASGFGGVMQNLGMGVMQGVGIAGFMGVTMAAGALVQGIGGAISAASDLNETVSKVKVVFGPAAQGVLDFGKDAARGMGMSQNAALAAAGTMGNLFVAMGVVPQASANMSTGLVKLAGDLASFNNADPAEVLEALRSGLVGESEPMRRFGVQLSETRVQQEALTLGLWDGTGALSDAAKAQARYSIILKDSKTAQGDFARTSSGLANQQRIAAARMEDSMARVGQAILPVATAILPVLADAFAGLLDWIGQILEGIGKWVAENKFLMSVLGSLVSFIVTGVGTALAKLFEWIGGAMGLLGDIIGGVADFIRSTLQGIVDGLIVVADAASQLPGPWQEAAVGMRDSLIGMRSEIALWGKETTETAGEAGGAIPGAVAAPMAAGEALVSGAAGDMLSGVAPAVGVATGEAKAAARLTPRQIADELRGGTFNVKDAAAALKDAQKTELTKTKEIAKIEGFLTGDALQKALKSKKAGVRAEAEAWKAAAEERLWALKNGVPELAAKTGISYAEALARKKKEVAEKARTMAEGQLAPYRALQADARRYGTNTGEAYGDGLSRTRAYIGNAARAALGAAQKLMYASSPPPDPRNPLHKIDVWGARTARAYADAFGSEEGYLRGKVAGFLGAAAPLSSLTPELRATINPAAISAAQSVTVIHEIHDPDGSLTKIGTTPGDVADAIVRGIDATGLFDSLRHVASMRGS